MNLRDGVSDPDWPYITEVDKFWIGIGILKARAIFGISISEQVSVYESRQVIDAVRADGAAEAGSAAYLFGLKRELLTLLRVKGSAALRKGLLAASDSVNVSVLSAKPARRRKTVETYDEDGRILSMIDEDASAETTPTRTLSGAVRPLPRRNSFRIKGSAALRKGVA